LKRKKRKQKVDQERQKRGDAQLDNHINPTNYPGRLEGWKDG
jgi:hypothetical protein